MTKPPKEDTPGTLTPMVRQYNAIKAQYPHYILMFRMGDFFEMFNEDARIASEILGIALTKRPWGDGRDMPLAGVPFHALDAYLAKFIRAGKKVAICDQTEDPRKAKGIVKREVVRIVTPGTILESDILDDKAHNFLASVSVIAAKTSSPDKASSPEKAPAQDKATFLSPAGASATASGVSTTASSAAEAWGLAVTDLSTGSFEITEFRGPKAASQIFSEMGRLQPAEILLPESLRKREGEWLDPALRPAITWLPNSDFEPSSARRRLLDQFQVQGLEGYGAEGLQAAIGAAGALVQYLRDTQLAALRNINHLNVYNPSNFLVLDFTTQRSLELVQSIHGGGRAGTLLEVLDHTLTAMGGRMLRGWVLQPLKEVAAIRDRLDAVEELYNSPSLRAGLSSRLRKVQDLERIISRIGLGVAGPRDLAALRQSLEQVEPLIRSLSQGGASADPPANMMGRGPSYELHGASADPPANMMGRGPSYELHGASTDPPANGRDGAPDIRSSLLRDLRRELDPHPVLLTLLQRAIADNPPNAVRDSGVIREGYNPELDELRSLATNTSDWMERMRREEIARTGIANLKISFNKVFGYYFEVSKGNLANVPADYIRKQTLVNAERFITPALKEKEEIILNAQEKIAEIEARLFEEIRAEAAAQTRTIQRLADTIARLDCLYGLSAAAIAGKYTRPEVDDGETIHIRAGRHPVVEALQTDRPFVPNDVLLSNTKDQILLITGPNMAGKSTFIRQVALLTLMAQMGGFIPASAGSRIGVVDRIFTRVGAMDYLVRGQSTFLVEMSETANILNNTTDRSLVILDEIGRGTSTYDGLSIAWAVVEYLHATEGRRPKTLFATHYHELTDLENELARVRNFNVAVLEQGGEITFLYQIVKGSTDHSYGIYAGKVAGLPKPVIERAKTILHQLEFGHAPAAKGVPGDRKVKVESDDGMVQLTLFDGLDHPVLETLRALDVNALTPLQALQLLEELSKKAK